mmetsp:Transcript_10067/g.22578  ORF Transcript_10067/g.22578 Transcript_10067/m.22578 type:complete len:259 (+) Transcript_10067:405-1181(+)
MDCLRLGRLILGWNRAITLRNTCTCSLCLWLRNVGSRNFGCKSSPNHNVRIFGIRAIFYRPCAMSACHTGLARLCRLCRLCRLRLETLWGSREPGSLSLFFAIRASDGGSLPALRLRNACHWWGRIDRLGNRRRWRRCRGRPPRLWNALDCWGRIDGLFGNRRRCRGRSRQLVHMRVSCRSGTFSSVGIRAGLFSLGTRSHRKRCPEFSMFFLETFPSGRVNRDDGTLVSMSDVDTIDAELFRQTTLPYTSEAHRDCR